MIFSFFSKVKAAKLYNEGNIKESFEIYDKLIKGNKDDGLKLTYSFLLLKEEQIEKSKEILNSVNTSKLKDHEKITYGNVKAVIFVKEGQIKDAIEILEETYNKYKNTIIYQNLGYFYILDEDYDKALKFNLEAYDYSKDDRGIIDNLALSYYYKGDLEKSQELYEKLMPLKPTYPEAYYNYGIVLKKLGKIEEAKEKFKEALECKFTYITFISKEDVEKELEELK
ncbi:tetratricopeptide repeat protein [Clostridium fallax]|uniref:Tetratricopeptide repeat-containing protein n=1 Tax=Clostridium fallax TaxID=1533 RepID=A0A1M4SV40_9CLOT|nr:tetratricopeptide repeat protein [Clostridium fallax]SHE35837.1 Tetratricopeptide repeat-containing protein [Clostridium fallax]SQB07978.1 TPR repeat-containing protein [Clostridium fallax]